MEAEMTPRQREMLDILLSDETARPVQIVAPITDWDDAAYLFWRLGRHEFEVDITPAGELGYLIVYNVGRSNESMREHDDASVATIMDILRTLVEALP